MSVQAITCALAIRGVSASEKLLLLALANYADENMTCWPSQRRLAADCSLTERTVRSLLAGLEDRRLVSRQEHRRKDGSRATDRITLHFSGEVRADADQQAEMVSGGGEVSSGGTGNQRRGVPEMVSGLTTFEPPLEPSKEPSLSASPSPRDDVRIAVAEWNALAERLGLPQARTVSGARLRAVKARLAEGGLERWREALRALERSAHCRGENDRGWRADLDFLCQPKSWNRLLEGFYDPKSAVPRKPVVVSTVPVTPEMEVRRLRYYRDTGDWKDGWGPKPDADGDRRCA